MRAAITYWASPPWLLELVSSSPQLANSARKPGRRSELGRSFEWAIGGYSWFCSRARGRASTRAAGRGRSPRKSPRLYAVENHSQQWAYYQGAPRANELPNSWELHGIFLMRPPLP